jgi:arylsulfatase
MRTPAWQGLALAAWVCAAASACSSEPAPPSPARRVILVTVDTLRADHLGCYGYARPTSPRLDELARECLVFDSAWSAAPLTVPSISALLGGRPPEELGVASRANGLRMPAAVRTLPELLRESGIDTAAFVSSCVLVAPPSELGDVGVAQGFAHYDDELGKSERNRGMPERGAADCTSAVLRWLEARPAAADRFFLWVHYQDPHGPYTPPEADRRLFERPHEGEAELPLGTNSSGLGQIPDYQQLDGERRPGPYVDGYDAEIHGFDAEFGRLLDGLRARGWLDDALLVFTADHGESLGEGGSWFCHGETLQHELLRVPLLVRPPRAARLAARREPAVASYLDLWPTVLEALAVAGPENRGLSLLARELPQGRIAAQSLGSARLGRQWLAITDGRWRLLACAPEPARLFDLERDPDERLDLAAERPEIVARLRRAHAELLARHGSEELEGVLRESDEETQRALRQFGYTPGADGDR